MLQPRAPFVYLRARSKRKSATATENTDYVTENVATSTDVSSLRKRGCDVVQVLVTHAQRSDDVSIFLYSHLDVPVQHAFFTNTRGELNIRNLQRFESKSRSETLTVLNSVCKHIDVSGYRSLRTLILVSCSLVRLSAAHLPSLELLDLRHNRLEHLPESLTSCTKLKTIKCAFNRIRSLPSNLESLSAVLTY